MLHFQLIHTNRFNRIKHAFSTFEVSLYHWSSPDYLGHNSCSVSHRVAEHLSIHRYIVVLYIIFWSFRKIGPSRNTHMKKTVECYTLPIYKCYTYRLSSTQWLSGIVLDSRSRCRGFEPHRCHCVVSLSKTYLS